MLDTPPAIEEPELRIWFHEPRAIFVVQIRVATVDEMVVVAMVRCIDVLRTKHAEAIAAHGGAWSIHDWRNVQHFPIEARHRLQQEWEKLDGRDVRRLDVALSQNPLMHARAQVMSLVSMRRAGTPIRIVDDVEALLKSAEL